MKLFKKEYLQLVILAAPFCAAALLWDRLPERIPIHWNYRGEIDGYGSRALGALGLPLLNLMATVMVGFLPLIDPRVRRQEPGTAADTQETFRKIRLVLSSFLAVVSMAVLVAGAGMPINIHQVIGIGLGALFLALGTLMGKVRPNYFIGIRTPWTLDNREVWTRTHRLAGKMMMIAGSIMLVGTVVIPAPWSLFLGSGVLAVGVPLVYSFVIHRRLRPA